MLRLLGAAVFVNLLTMLPASGDAKGASSEPPSGTKSLALIVDDPDAPDPKAPKLTWVHWVLYNLPPTAGQLPEAVAPDTLLTGTREGLNDWKRAGYGGPCPPIGRHRYIDKLLSLRHCAPRARPAHQGAA